MGEKVLKLKEVKYFRFPSLPEIVKNFFKNNNQKLQVESLSATHAEPWPDNHEPNHDHQLM